MKIIDWFKRLFFIVRTYDYHQRVNQGTLIQELQLKVEALEMAHLEEAKLEQRLPGDAVNGMAQPSVRQAGARACSYR